MRPYSQRTPVFFRIFFFCNQSKFFFDAQTIFWVNLAMLSRYQSPVNFRSRKVKRAFTQKVNHLTFVIFQTLNLYSCLLELDGLPSQGHGNG
jgi:hypothetical protein